MELLQLGECFEEICGQYQFSGTMVIYRNEGRVYHSISKSRLLEITDITTTTLRNKVEIPFETYAPSFISSFTRAPDCSSPDCFIKRPSLLSHDFAKPYLISESVLAEVKVCELLRLHPHPNIARYLGCEVCDERITGICLRRYGDNLMERFNPKKAMKRAVNSRQWSIEKVSRYMDGVSSAVRHLHALELTHNDINPANIMFDDDDVPIVIDFGSCRAIGDSLDGVGRTYEWYDERIQQSIPTNDLDAVEEIREWLSDKDVKTFKFKE